MHSKLKEASDELIVALNGDIIDRQLYGSAKTQRAEGRWRELLANYPEHALQARRLREASLIIDSLQADQLLELTQGIVEAGFDNPNSRFLGEAVLVAAFLSGPKPEPETFVEARRQVKRVIRSDRTAVGDVATAFLEGRVGNSEQGKRAAPQVSQGRFRAIQSALGRLFHSPRT